MHVRKKNSNSQGERFGRAGLPFYESVTQCESDVSILGTLFYLSMLGLLQCAQWVCYLFLFFLLHAQAVQILVSQKTECAPSLGVPRSPSRIPALLCLNAIPGTYGHKEHSRSTVWPVNGQMSRSSAPVSPSTGCVS